MLGFERSAESIGYTLPETSVTTIKIPVESDVMLANLYSSILWVLYTISILVFLAWYHKNEDRKKLIHEWIDNNEGLTVGIFTTMVTVGMFEGTTRLASCIAWTHHVT